MLTGSMPAEAVVYDATEACTYGSMEFPVTFGSCFLWVMLDDGGADGGVGLSAAVEPDQTCDLSLPSGSVHLTVSSGSLSVDTVTELVIAGDIVPADAGAPRGYLQWSFTGQ